MIDLLTHIWTADLEDKRGASGLMPDEEARLLPASR